jgi:hypothetical protein
MNNEEDFTQWTPRGSKIEMPVSLGSYALARAIKTLGYNDDTMVVTDEEIEDAPSYTLVMQRDEARKQWMITAL